jgi:hypothetical protein
MRTDWVSAACGLVVLAVAGVVIWFEHFRGHSWRDGLHSMTTAPVAPEGMGRPVQVDVGEGDRRPGFYENGGRGWWERLRTIFYQATHTTTYGPDSEGEE